MATTPPPKAGAKKPAGGSNLLTQKYGPLPVWGWLVVAVGAYYLYKKIYGGSSSTAASGTTGAISATTLPTETLTTAGGTYTGPIGSVPGSISNPISGSGPGGTAPPSDGQPSAGFGTYSYGGTTYDILGVESTNGPQGYAGYNVGGGAPVYYQTTGNAPSQGSGQAVQGAQVLTPAIYSGQVTQTANHNPQSG